MNLKQFISENINLPKDKYEKGKQRAEKVQEVIKVNRITSNFDYQGSFARKTVVRPKFEDEEFDIDIVAMSYYVDLSITRQFAESIAKVLRKEFPNQPVSVFGSAPTKATQIVFNKEFHIDVVPLLLSQNKEYVYDVAKNQMILSNPVIFSKAFNEKNKLTAENSLRESVKLIKYIRNLERSRNSTDINVPSIAIDLFLCSLSHPTSGNFDMQVEYYLSAFIKNFTSSTSNPYVPSEVINSPDAAKLVQKVELYLNKIKQKDFTGMRKAFVATGATFASIASAASVSAAVKTYSSGIHVSGKDK